MAVSSSALVSAANTHCADRLQSQFINVVSDFGAPRDFTPTSEGADAAPAINNAISAVVSTWGTPARGRACSSTHRMILLL